MKTNREFDVALSFAGEDRTYIDEVANLLRDSGVKVFYDLFEEANLWGKNLYEYLSDIYMNKAVYTIMFISKSYAEKMWANLEREAMQARAFQESQEYILPARFDDTVIPGILPTTAYISLKERAPSSLVEIIQRKLINSGLTIPSESTRRSLFSTVPVPRVDPKRPCIIVHSTEGEPINEATIVAIADNNTTKSAKTRQDGIAELIIPTRRQCQLLIAHPNFPGAIVPSWDPDEDIEVSLAVSEDTGSVICMSTGYIPGLSGRLNPILDTSNRTYIYADNIAVDGGRNQLVTFKVNEPFELEDSDGVVMQVRVLHIQGRTSLLQFVHSKSM